MGASNRVQVLAVRETTAGTTPASPRMRTVRTTGESLNFAPEYVDSDEIRSDRMLGDPIKVMQASRGGINFELSYPTDESPLSEFFRSACFAAWSNTNQRDNDGTADSVITDVATVNTVLTVATGTAFVAGEVYKWSGFGVAGNNGNFKCTTGSATVPQFAGSGVTNEPVPPAAARVKCIGFEGASGDITATATGLASTALNFTTIPGLVAGKWIKIDSTTAAYGFATAANNDWARITAVAANALTLDNRPSGWSTDAGTGKTIRVYFGDQIKNGTMATSLTIEKGFLDQAVPSYIVNTGMQVNSMTVNMASKNKITGSVEFLGMGGSASTTPLDASPDVATTGLVMAANANVGRLGIDGSQLTSPNWAKSLELTISNNLRAIEAVDSTAPVQVNPGECQVTGKISTYFGSLAELTKFYNSTATAVNARVAKNSQAIIFQVPRATYRGGGNPVAGGKNQDVALDLDLQASYDSTTGAHICVDRLEFFA